MGRSAAFNLANIVTTVATGLLLSVTAARLWPSSTYATYLYLSWLAGTLAIVAGAAFPALAVRLVAELRARGDDRRARGVLATLATATAAGALLLGGVGLGVDRLTGWLDIRSGAAAVIALAVAQALSTVVVYGAQGATRFDLPFTRNIFTLAAATVGACVLVAGGASPTRVLSLLAIGHVAYALAMANALRRELRSDRQPGLSRDVTVTGTLRAERGYFTIVTGIAFLDLVVWQKSELWFLRRLATDLDLALYSTAFALTVAAVRMAPAALAGVLTPTFAGLAGRGDRDQLPPVYRHAVIAMASSTAALSLVALGIGRSLLSIYGPSFLAAYPLLPWLALGFTVGNVSGVASTVFHGFGRADLLLKAGLALAATNIALDVLLIEPFGALGAAQACAGAQILSLPISVVLLRRALGVRLPYAPLARLAVSTAAGVGAGLASRLIIPPPSVVSDLLATTLSLATAGIAYGLVGGFADLRTPVAVTDPEPPSDPTPEVTIIVPTKNRVDFVERCVTQALAQEGPSRELIVVDSSDDERTQELLEARFPEVRRVRVRHMPNNRHFAKNQGIRLARGRVLLFLDDDSFAEPGWLERHVALYDDPTVGCAGGRIIDEVFAAGPVGDSVGLMEPSGKLHLNFTVDPGAVIEVDHVIGCNMSFRAEALRRSGDFDLSYGGPNFMEETDLFIRVKRCGYRGLFHPDAVVFHANAPRDGGLERRALDPRGEFWSARSRAYFAWKLLPRTPAVFGYNALGFLKLHALSALRKRAPIHIAAMFLQAGGMVAGTLDWLVAGRPRVAPRPGLADIE